MSKIGGLSLLSKKKMKTLRFIKFTMLTKSNTYNYLGRRTGEKVNGLSLIQTSCHIILTTFKAEDW